MEDVLISQETVKLANEKGFNEYTSRMKSLYVILEDLWEQDHHNGNDFLMYAKDEIITSEESPSHPGVKFKCLGRRPTQSILQKWLRDEHQIDVWVEKFPDDERYFPQSPQLKLLNGIGTFFNYEEALEVILQMALTVIKQK